MPFVHLDINQLCDTGQIIMHMAKGNIDKNNCFRQEVTHNAIYSALFSSVGRTGEMSGLAQQLFIGNAHRHASAGSARRSVMIGRLSASRARQRGVAAVEFAFAAILFFTLLFSILDWSYLFFVNLTMQHAVREGARYAVTGQSNLSPTPGDRCAAAREKIRGESMGLYDQTSSTTVFKTIDSSGNIAVLGSGSCYGAGQLIIIQVDSRLSPITPFIRPFFSATGNQYRFSVSTTMKNEAFP